MNDDGRKGFGFGATMELSLSTVEEKQSEGACWKNSDQLMRATRRLICEGLVERDEEALLVVLATVVREYLLLLGTPGTCRVAQGVE